MGEIIGIVEKISTFKTKNNKDMYSVTVNGENFTNLGIPPKKIREGAEVKIEFVINRGYKNIKELKILKQGEIGAYMNSNNKARQEDYWKKKEQRITRMWAYGQANQAIIASGIAEEEYFNKLDEIAKKLIERVEND